MAPKLATLTFFESIAGIWNGFKHSQFSWKKIMLWLLGDRSLLSLNFSESGSKKKKQIKAKLPPRPDDYDDYWYQDDDGTWRNEYDDEGYEFADDEYDLEEAEEIAQAIKDEGQARAEAERSQYAAQGDFT